MSRVRKLLKFAEGKTVEQLNVEFSSMDLDLTEEEELELIARLDSKHTIRGVRNMKCSFCGSEMSLEENYLDNQAVGYVWHCSGCGFERPVRRHMHSRNCYDDSGHGSPYLVCGKIEGELE